MYTFLLVTHVVAASVLILSIVVFQTSKGSALAMFGGGGDSLFNSATGTSFIKKFTITVGAVFAATSLLLTVFGASNRMHSVVQEYPLQAPQQQAPAAPAAQPAADAAAPKAPISAQPAAGAPAPSAAKPSPKAQPAKAVPAPVKK
ncbi:MAG TPA: preprotein translocase subunit SecG [Elusimicrobia bacterium]|nr:preprotein translocase subunit SecG [Elusimicrobiota bacterium]